MHLRVHVCISVSLIRSGQTGCLFPAFVLELHMIMLKKPSELGGLEMVSLSQTKLAHVKVLRPAMKTHARTTFSFCPVAHTFARF